MSPAPTLRRLLQASFAAGTVAGACGPCFRAVEQLPGRSEIPVRAPEPEPAAQEARGGKNKKLDPRIGLQHLRQARHERRDRREMDRGPTRTGARCRIVVVQNFTEEHRQDQRAAGPGLRSGGQGERDGKEGQAGPAAGRRQPARRRRADWRLQASRRALFERWRRPGPAPPSGCGQGPLGRQADAGLDPALSAPRPHRASHRLVAAPPALLVVGRARGPRGRPLALARSAPLRCSS